MSEPAPGSVTRLLHAWKSDNDLQARDELFLLVEPDLHAVAQRTLRRMGGFDHKVQPTEIVSELFLKLNGYDVTWENRKCFFGMIAKVVRNILLDMARHDDAGKRPRSTMRVATADIEQARHESADYEVLDFYRALDRLSVLNQRHAATFELHAVVGLTLEEIALQHEVSAVTAKRDLRAAKVWLRRALASHATS